MANTNGAIQFAVGDANEFIKFDTSTNQLQIASSDIEVTASNVDISTGQIKIDGK